MHRRSRVRRPWNPPPLFPQQVRPGYLFAHVDAIAVLNLRQFQRRGKNMLRELLLVCAVIALIVAGINWKAPAAEPAPAVRKVVLVLDRSGSMKGRKIDDARQTATIAKEKITYRVTDLEKQRAELVEKEKELKENIGELSQEISESRQEVEAPLLEVYDRTKKILAKPPYIAPIEDQKCSGCNLRVSNDVISSVLVEQKLTQCDQCGRIVYVER